MSSHAHHQAESLTSHQEMRVSPGVLKNVHERARERWHRQHPDLTSETGSTGIQEAKRLELIANLDRFCQERGVDITTTKPADEPKLAHAVHDYVSGVVHSRARMVRRLADDNETSPVIHTVPQNPIRRRIDEQYAKLGLNRRAKPDDLRMADEKLLSDRKRHVFAKIFLQDDTGPDMPKDEAASEPRYAKYPEIGIVMQVRDLCNDRGYLVAADGAEVVQAAYGQRFMDLVSYADIIVENDAGERRTIQRQFDIPDDVDVQAENWRGIRGKTE
jgi:hypothetical protein